MLWLLPVIALTSAGSADRLGSKKYVFPGGDTPRATVKFLKGNLRLSMMRGDTQYYGVMKDDTCKATERLLTYSGGIGGNTQEKVLDIEAGRPIRLMGSLTKQSYGGYQYEAFFTCSGVAEFTPVAGKDYLVTQASGEAKAYFSCPMTVREADTGKVPDDLRTAAIPACR